MMINVQQQPYLRRQRNFPSVDLKTIALECDKSYIDVAQKVNERTIGTFALNASVVTGEAWYIQGSSQKQQTLRQLYLITPDNAGIIETGISPNGFAGFTKIYGTFTDGIIWYPLPYVDVLNVTNQVNIWVTDSQIVINQGGGGGQPTVQSGFVVLEWLSKF
jgi:hypothetical protein